MNSERYQAYLEALEHVEGIDPDLAGERAAEELRDLVQDVLLCRELADVEALLEQIATAATQMTASGALSREASIYLWNAALACEPAHPQLEGRTIPTLVAG